MSPLFALGGQSIGTSTSASVLPMNIQGWFPLGLTALISLLSKGPSRVFSSTTVLRHQFFGAQHIKEQRHHFVDKDAYSQSYGFSSSHVWMWELDHKEGWVPKNGCFEFWCWRRLLRRPWTARRSNQSILKETNSEYSLQGLMLKLKLQYFVYLMWRADSLEKTLMLGKIEDKRRRGQQRMRWLDAITD